MSIPAAVNRLRERIAAAARRAGRSPEDVTVVAATKGIDLEQIEYALVAGLKDLGENRIQEAAPKIERVGHQTAAWHLIGHLQRNKAREALKLFDLIQSVDSLRLAADLSRRTAAAIEILLQVNVSGERQKHGFTAETLERTISEIAVLPRLHITGLMTIAPISDDAEAARPVFRRLRELRDRLNGFSIPGLLLRHLSMGMSDDFEVAVEEGATIVRIGRALFGERVYGG